MSVRKRTWTSPNGKPKEAWVVDCYGADGKRRLKTFKTKVDAVRYSGIATAARAGIVPEPLTAKQLRPIEFDIPLPAGRWRDGPGRDALRTALRAACPTAQPTTDSVVLHLIVQVPPRAVVSDIDNLLKPVIDALSGVAWTDNNQVYELLVRRVHAHTGRLRIRFWQLPQPAIMPHLNTLMDARLILDWRR